MKKSTFFSLILVAIAFTFPAYAAINMKDAMGVWTFDEGNGKEAGDISGNNHNGEITGNVKWVDGKYGKALEFSGGNVKVPHTEDMNLETFTMTAWLKIPAVVPPYQMVMGKEAWPNRNYSIWLLPEKANVGLTEPADKQLQSAAVVVDGTWRHIAATYDMKFLRIYVDGQVSNQLALTTKPLLCDAPFMIGAQPPAGGGPIQGIIDEVSVFKVGLSEDDIKDIMEKGLKQFVTSVERTGKLSTTWGMLKR